MTKDEIYQEIRCLEYAGYKVYYSNHGFDEACVRLEDPGNNHTLLVKPANDDSMAADLVVIICMCLDKKHEFVLFRKLLARIIDLKGHACTPWPG